MLIITLHLTLITLLLIKAYYNDLNIKLYLHSDMTVTD